MLMIEQYIGSPWPKLTYGFNLKLGFKNLDLTALLQWRSRG